MKRFLIVLFMLTVSMIMVFADTHLGRTENSVTDSSFIVQGYYKGVQETGSDAATLTFTDYSSQQIIHNTQSTDGTKVPITSNHLNNDGIIFSWSLLGSANKTTTLKFTFSVLQAYVNGYYYRPTYTLKMTINPTSKNRANNGTMTDTFYSNVPTADRTRVVGGGTTTGTKAVQDTEFTGAAIISYSGKTTNAGNNSKWYRSGTCTLNITDYEQELPGTYQYVCWVVTEFSIE